MSHNILKVKDLYYFQGTFTHEGSLLPSLKYYRLVKIHRDENQEIASVDIEIVFEPENYLQGKNYESKIVNTPKNLFTPAISALMMNY